MRSLAREVVTTAFLLHFTVVGELLIATIIMRTLFSISSVTGQSCSEGDVRLEDGLVENEGRVEICVSDGRWSTICSSSLFTSVDWGLEEASVACRQLGFNCMARFVIKLLNFLIIFYRRFYPYSAV